MSNASSSEAGWYTRLEPVDPPDDLPRREDDPRLGEVVEFWRAGPPALWPGRAVVIGFPQDEGVQRNGGRVGAAEAPREIRRWLYRLVPWDGATGVHLGDRPPLDLGNVRIDGPLEATQDALGSVVVAVRACGAVPVILGGGHETAYGHYLGHVAATGAVGVINVDAHLDVRPLIEGRGHSGSPFRQMLEHPDHPLPGSRYVCLGVQPQGTSREHWRYVQQRGGELYSAAEARGNLADHLVRLHDEWSAGRVAVYLTIDADAVHARDVPGVSAPNVAGLDGDEVLFLAREAGTLPGVAGIDLVEINPRHDRDSQSAHWAALLVWHFLVGLASRTAP
jgi:formiminoglutamase